MQCYGCQLKVRGTTHRPTSYKVDYLLHTGHTEWEFFSNPKPDSPSFQYLKFTQPKEIFTGNQCYAHSEIRQRLDDDFARRRPPLNFYPKENTSTDPAAKG
jgi:hypothetical protein